MTAHGFVTDEERFGHLPIGRPAGDPGQNLDLPPSQAAGKRSRRDIAVEAELSVDTLRGRSVCRRDVVFSQSFVRSRHAFVDLGRFIPALLRSVFPQRGMQRFERRTVIAAPQQHRSASVCRPGPEPGSAESLCSAFEFATQRLGFIDGTANPILLEAPQAALVPDGRRGAGGSHVLTMRWVHDLDAFDRLPQDQQENVFGRTKPDSIEFVGARLPPNAHIARVQIDDEAGEEVQIYRRSVPYGTTLEHGINFLAFAADRARFDRMLARMFGPNDDGLHDRLADFSRPVSGAYYFAPSLNMLNELAGPEND